MKELDWLSLWNEALHSPHGVVIAVSDIAAAKAALYRTRQSSGIPELKSLQIRTSPLNPNTELWLVRG